MTNSTNELNIYGTVTNWCDELTQQIPVQLFSRKEKSMTTVTEQLCQNLESEMKNTVIQTSQTNIQVARDRLRNQEKFENLWVHEENCLGECFRTVHDVNDNLVKTDRIMQRIHVISWWARFWDLRTRRSCQSVTSESNFILIDMKSRYSYCLCRKRISLLDWDILRSKFLCESFLTGSRWLLSRHWDNEFHIRWLITRSNIKYWRILCVEVTGIIEFDELSFWRVHRNRHDEVEWHSFLR